MIVGSQREEIKSKGVNGVRKHLRAATRSDQWIQGNPKKVLMENFFNKFVDKK